MPSARGANIDTTSATRTGACRPSDSVLRERSCVVIRERLALELREEPFVVPHFEKLHLAEDVHVAGHSGSLSEAAWNENAALDVELGDLSVEIDAVEELDARRMGAWHLRQPVFHCDPHRHRVDADGVSRQARDVHTLGAVLVLDKRLEGSRDLQPPFVVN